MWSLFYKKPAAPKTIDTESAKDQNAASRVAITQSAADLIIMLKQKHGPLMFHQSGGCCDGSAPMCYPAGEFKVGDADILIDTIAGCPFYISKRQYEAWAHTHLTIDVVDGRGASFSLEIPEGKRFITRSRLFKEEERKALPPLGNH